MADVASPDQGRLSANEDPVWTCRYCGDTSHPAGCVPSLRFWTLSSLRAHREMSLRDLGRRTGISSGLLSLMERGLLLPNSQQLGRIVEALAPGARAHVRFDIEIEEPE